MQISWYREKANSLSWLADGLAAIGGFLYLVQSWRFIHTQLSVLDEGAYLVSGYLFATRRYWPFQDYGPWTNQMPLSFLIPGSIQVLFGPGLRVGRYFTVLLALLMLSGLWIVVKRLGGRWLAAGAVLAITANPAIIKMYSQATSQALVACLLVWTLVLTLGADRPLWQSISGACLAAVIVLTRLNMIPVLPLLIGYIFWQSGRRAGFLASVAGLAVLILGHAAFWPGILRMWAEWLPATLTPFLDPWRPPEGIPLWDPNIRWQSRLLSLLLGIRFHFVAVVGVITALLLWAKRGNWRSEISYRSSLFLVSLFLVLFLAHAWASLGINPQTFDALGKNYCVFCFPSYTAFYSNIGLILVAASFGSWIKRLNYGRQFLILAVILGLSIGIGFSSYDPVGDIWLSWRVPRILTFLRTGEILSGYVPFKLFIQRWGLEYAVARRLFPAAVGLMSGILILGFAGLIARIQSRNNPELNNSSGYLAIIGFLMAGWFLTPTVGLGAGFKTFDCRGDVLKSYESVGSYLAGSIPAGAKIYWQGGDSPIPLLYLPSAVILPPQLNGIYTFRQGGETQSLLKYGFWNEEIADSWLQEANYIIVEEAAYEAEIRTRLKELGYFSEVGLTPSPEPCREDARLNILVHEKREN